MSYLLPNCHIMKWIVSIVLFSLCLISHGQQRPQFTQYMLNKYSENPAYGGLERSLSIFSSFRDQYSAFPGNPRTFYVGADMPFYLWNGAIGFTFFNQRAGVFSNSNFKVSYNYVMGTPVGFLSFGGRVGLDFLSVDGSGIITPDGNYEGVINHNDPLLGVTTYTGAGPSWEVGSYFMGRNIEVGVTVSELPVHEYSIGDGKYLRDMTFSLFAQYKYRLNDLLVLRPSMLVKGDRAVIQGDLGVSATYNKNLIFGANLRGYNTTSLDAFSVIIGTNLGKKYVVSYSYDFGLSALRTFHQGTHEIMLSYNMQRLIGLGLPPKIIYNPRDL